MVKIIRKLISTANAPRPVAPYNQAVLVDRTLYVSGVVGLNKDTMKLVDGGVVEETRQALTHLGYILKTAETSYDKVVKCTVLLKDMKDFAAVNEVYNEFFTCNYPARIAYEVANLPLNASVEIDAIAVTGEVTTVTVTEGGCCKL